MCIFEPEIQFRMLKHLRINAAIFVCLAFIFRLLFVNFSFFPECHSLRSDKLSSEDFSSIKKRRRLSNVDAKSDVKYYSQAEVFEEGSGSEEDSGKAASPLILSVLYSFFHQVSFAKPGCLFDLIKCQLYPKKYLALSILRI